MGTSRFFFAYLAKDRQRDGVVVKIAGLALAAIAVLAVCSMKCLQIGEHAGLGVHAAETQDPIRYSSDGSYLLPDSYREWIFLSSGMDMSYDSKSPVADHHMFNNVFVSPAAYRSFQQTGTWPDKTVLVLEIRAAESQPTLNKRGQTQGRDAIGMEVHLKDQVRFRDGWAFFDVGKDGKGRYFQPTADCYSCHREHAAVDTTFAQFYPTLMPVAEAHKTLSANYLRERVDTAR